VLPCRREDVRMNAEGRVDVFLSERVLQYRTDLGLLFFPSLLPVPLICSFCTEIQSNSTALSSFKAAHPHLAEKADLLPDVMMADRAPATVKKYSGAFQRWCSWAAAHRLSSLPAEPVGVALYLLHLSSDAQSPSPIKAALQGIDWAHRHAGQTCPGVHHVTRQVADGLIRILSRPARKMQPLTLQQLDLLIGRYGQPQCSLADLQMICLFTLGYRGFFRWNDLSNLTIDDIHISEEYLSVFLAGRKNDQFREGHVIPIARSASASCALRWMQRFLGEGNHAPHAPLFGKVSITSRRSYIRGQMTYSCARERMKSMLSAVDIDPSRLSLHSLRAGGVSAALRSPGVPVRLVQRHGGWRRLESLEGYVEETLDNLLCVSRHLD